MSQDRCAASPESPPDDAPHLLVVDDDMRIRTLLTRFLGANGFRVTAAASAAEARRQIAAIAFDLLVVDVMMPGESGLEFTEALRQTSSVPILMLTARSEAAPHPRAGGRRRRLSRQAVRAARAAAAHHQHPEARRRSRQPPAIEIDPLRPVHLPSRARRAEARRRDRAHHRPRARDPAHLRRAARARPSRRHEFLKVSNGGGERAVDVQINRLRRKIEADPSNPIYLQTARGIGYRLLVD